MVIATLPRAEPLPACKDCCSVPDVPRSEPRSNAMHGLAGQQANCYHSEAKGKVLAQRGPALMLCNDLL